VNEFSSLHQRRKIDDGADDDKSQSMSNGRVLTMNDNNLQKELQEKRENYNKIMEKGNERTRLAFDSKKDTKKQEHTDMMDEELDDSFLNAALAKARRLNRMRETNKASSIGADAVADAVKSTSVESNGSKQSPGISFSIDDTREFSRAIRARANQKERESQKPSVDNLTHASMSTNEKMVSSTGNVNDEKTVKNEYSENDEDVQDMDMEELAKQVQEDPVQLGFEGSTADSVGVGRGLASFVSMLKTTGEITGKHGGKEELRGRAKDERNYENYEPLDLSKVVAIGKNASEKDQELANREVKLEYRDKHGRLLTQKEAYRDLCYQFHGHGASKRKEEKRLKQIAREQAEARLASGQGTLGALKATQKATGKAFIVHKT